MRFLWAGQQARSIPSPPNLQISRLGVTPKKGQPRKWHLNVDLSSPAGGGEGASVNDGLARISLLFITLLLIKIVHLVSRLGKGALMAKFEVESAYRNVPVHPSDCYLLGVKWRNQYYVDLALPFGL